MSCFDPVKGFGAVQMSVFTRTRTAPMTISEGERVAVTFAAARNWNVPLDNISLRTIAYGLISEFEYKDKHTERYWRVAHVLSETRMALITYNCDEKDSAVETEIVTEILNSLQLATRPE